MTDEMVGWVIADEWVLQLEVLPDISLSRLDELRVIVSVLLAGLPAETSALLSPGRLRVDSL